MELANQKVVVVGLGKSGLAAAKLCQSRGAHVVGADRAAASALPAEVRDSGIELQLGEHDPEMLQAADLIVVSPGVPALPSLSKAAEAGVEVIGELELASRFVTAPVLAVGGTNGKSTATSLLAALLESAGLSVFAGANLGRPAAEAVDASFDVVVWEVSSFQMEPSSRALNSKSTRLQPEEGPSTARCISMTTCGELQQRHRHQAIWPTFLLVQQMPGVSSKIRRFQTTQSTTSYTPTFSPAQ